MLLSDFFIPDYAQKVSILYKELERSHAMKILIGSGVIGSAVRRVVNLRLKSS